MQIDDLKLGPLQVHSWWEIAKRFPNKEKNMHEQYQYLLKEGNVLNIIHCLDVLLLTCG